MENTYFVTITGLNHYYGKKPFEIGRIIRLIKEPDNEYDKEAIAAFLPFIDKIGYVANSTNTVYDGTISAGRLYDKIEDYAYGKVMFVTHSSAIVLDIIIRHHHPLSSLSHLLICNPIFLSPCRMEKLYPNNLFQKNPNIQSLIQ